MKNSSKLDDLLIDLADEWAEFLLAGKAGDGVVALNKAKQQIKDLMLDIIGEDEPTDIMESELGRGGARNQLRAVQRAKVEDL